jgi:hypothetical protein
MLKERTSIRASPEASGFAVRVQAVSRARRKTATRFLMGLLQG